MGSATGRPAGSSGRRRHRHRRRSRSGFSAALRPYGAAIIALLILIGGGVAAWYAAENLLHSSNGPANVATVTNSAPRVPPWEQDVLGYFEDAIQQAKAGNITGAEVQVDQAVAEMEEARVRSKAVSRDFFRNASTDLDNILAAHPGSESRAQVSDDRSSLQEAQNTPPDSVSARLFQHVTQARVELAAVRSWQQPMPAGADLAVQVAENRVQGGANSRHGSGAALDAPSPLSVSASGKLKLPAGHVDIEAPRELVNGEVLDPVSLHAVFLDASLMPDTSEILLPPEGRQPSDNVGVHNLTIAGASQTLDGIHWRNVIFIKTRLRYEDGPLDLENVRFVQCTFGFPSDARGASIANTIVLGETSVALR